MKWHLSLVALWASLTYLVSALCLTSWLCLDSVQVLSRESAKATGQLEFMSPAWVVSTADHAVSRLFWLGVLAALGVLFIGMSVVWVTVS